MSDFKGRTLSWQIVNGALELALHRDPCNEIGRSRWMSWRNLRRLCLGWE